jgi:hypothetical protein
VVTYKVGLPVQIANSDSRPTESCLTSFVERYRFVLQNMNNALIGPEKRHICMQFAEAQEFYRLYFQFFAYNGRHFSVPEKPEVVGRIPVAGERFKD